MYFGVLLALPHLCYVVCCSQIFIMHTYCSLVQFLLFTRGGLTNSNNTCQLEHFHCNALKLLFGSSHLDLCICHPSSRGLRVQNEVRQRVLLLWPHSHFLGPHPSLNFTFCLIKIVVVFQNPTSLVCVFLYPRLMTMELNTTTCMLML